MPFVFANNVKTTLAGSVSSGATTITLASTAAFPTIPSGSYMALTLNDAATQSIDEVVYVTSVSGSNVNVIRGQEGTTARSWASGDKAYAAVTAAELTGFATQSQLSGYVQLNPPSTQTGSIDINGFVHCNSDGRFVGVSVGGALTNATTGTFSSDVTALDLIASKAYGGTAIASMPLRFTGASTIGVGPSSAISSRSITASAFGIGASATGNLLALDSNGNLGINGNFYANIGTFQNAVGGAQVYQSGNQVVDTITSSTLSFSKSGSTYTLNIPASTQIPIGASLVSNGNGGTPSISLPNYGQWFVEVKYAVQQTNNSNMTLTLSLTAGTITGGFLSNANGHTPFNAQGYIFIYGKGNTSVNNQTLIFTLSVSGGVLDGSNQPWTVTATRTA